MALAPVEFSFHLRNTRGLANYGAMNVALLAGKRGSKSVLCKKARPVLERALLYPLLAGKGSVSSDGVML